MMLVADHRPKPSPLASTFTPQKEAMRRRSDTPGIQGPDGRERSLNDLSARPGSANYKAGIGRPPCAHCTQDHNPIRENLGEYDHVYVHPDEVGGGLVVMNSAPQPPEAAAAALPATSSAGAGTPRKRVTILSRNEESFVFVIEEHTADDWDDVESFRMTGEETLKLLPVLRALGTSIKDRTGGDLAALRLDAG